MLFWKILKVQMDWMSWMNRTEQDWELFKQRVDNCLKSELDNYSVPSSRLKEAMQYAVLNGGKRFRPVLIYLAGDMLNLLPEVLDSAACAVELIHCYSLVHDDLPAMDDDDLRRGKPACHRAFDEATAILAGDALQALAFECIAKDTALKSSQKNALLLSLAGACGAAGMASGQALDLEYLPCKETVSIEMLQHIHSLKTGALFSACIQMPVLLLQSPLSEPLNTALCYFAEKMGLAFQMQDDYLDYYGETAALGKQQGSDKAKGKATYADFFSQQDLLEAFCHVYQEAENVLKPFGSRSDKLKSLAAYLACRTY